MNRPISLNEICRNPVESKDAYWPGKELGPVHPNAPKGLWNMEKPPFFKVIQQRAVYGHKSVPAVYKWHTVDALQTNLVPLQAMAVSK